MTEEPISSIKKVEAQVNHSAQLYQAYQAYMAQNNRQRAPQTNGKANDPSSVSPEVARKVSKLAPGLGRTTALRFQVNPETNDLLVMVVDRETNKVINTIPPEAIKDIPVGDLMQYSI